MMKYIFVFWMAFICSMVCYAEITLNIVENEIAVDGKKTKILSITSPNGSWGITYNKDDTFNVKLVNKLKVPTSIHWHGLILPNEQDGVAFITQYPIYPQTEYHYQFPIVQSGTYFMHSHFGLQEQRLLSAPLIFIDPEDADIADKEVVVLLADFSFQTPEEIYQKLRCNNQKHDMNMSSMGSAKKDIVEVNYDAFLANFKTLDNPDIFQIAPGSTVRLRLINASSATNFWINIGKLDGEAIAVDGNRIEPLKSHEFELGIAQRIDILVKIPEEEGSFPILAQGEGTRLQTGFLLSTTNVDANKLSSQADQKAKAINNKQELLLRALHPLPEKKIDRQVSLELGGDMKNYVWTLNGQSWPYVTPVIVKEGERVEMSFVNQTAMTHPMHLHGHVFQVTEIDGKKLSGAMRDTVLVGPKSTVKIQFDANNPGVWPLHCHLLYHLEAGMLTVVRYEDYIQPLTP